MEDGVESLTLLLFDNYYNARMFCVLQYINCTDYTYMMKLGVVCVIIYINVSNIPSYLHSNSITAHTIVAITCMCTLLCPSYYLF